MTIVVVIPAFNEAKLIGRCLAAVKAAQAVWEARGWTCQIVVCDNNSTDGTAEIARQAGALVVREPENQIARARNRGAAAASGDWLLFVDADSFPSAELFDDLARAIESGRYLGGGSNVRLDFTPRGVWLWEQGWNWLSRLLRWAPGSFLFCEASAFREVGGFNEELYVAEEIDLSRRLKRLARQRGQRLVILHRHPLITSARKLDLYSRGEWGRFFLECLRRPSGFKRDRAACPIWYDGRR